LPATSPLKARFEFLLNDCPLKSKFKNLPATFSQKSLFEVLLDDCPLKITIVKIS
jgi:hypothetical protein